MSELDRYDVEAMIRDHGNVVSREIERRYDTALEWVRGRYDRRLGELEERLGELERRAAK